MSYTLEECGGACPTQATGTTADGTPFYFRFRHGWWALETFPGGTLYDWSHVRFVASGKVRQGEMGDGAMDESEVRALLDAHLP